MYQDRRGQTRRPFSYGANADSRKRKEAKGNEMYEYARKTASVPYNEKTSTIRITSYEKKNCAGVLINPHFGRDIAFENTTQLLFLIEQMLCDLDYPQRITEKRSFLEQETSEPLIDWQELANAAVEEKDPLASFRLRIMFRQSASWQGEVNWVEGERSIQFRSVLELLQLMDEILNK